jgi:hypothetical protein
MLSLMTEEQRCALPTGGSEMHSRSIQVKSAQTEKETIGLAPDQVQ